MKRARKRAPGGGRKRKPAREREGEWLTTRINPAIKARLESEAQARGYSVSRTAKEILVIGLKELQKRERDDSMRGLCYLIGQLELGCRQSLVPVPWEGTKPERQSRYAEELSRLHWRVQPFIAQAFKLAVVKLIDTLAPEGDPNHIDGFQHAMDRWPKTPERLANFVFDALWDELSRATLESKKGDFEEELFYDDQETYDWWRFSYRMIDARADLNIPQEKFSQFLLARDDELARSAADFEYRLAHDEELARSFADFKYQLARDEELARSFADFEYRLARDEKLVRSAARLRTGADFLKDRK